MKKLSEMIRNFTGKKYYTSAVILAAGEGSRFGDGELKQFCKIRGVPVLVRSAAAFERSELINEIVVVTRRADVEKCRELLTQFGITKLKTVVAGGETRQESAKLGFDVADPKCNFVALHDAARCLVTPEMISSVMDRAYTRGAAAAASRAVDTVKKTDRGNIVKETLDRDDLWLVQTPQVFMADMYRAAAYMAEKDKFVSTDDCALCERLGFTVELVDCGKTNIKVTYPEDVVIADAILTSREDVKA